ncbi:hypothetical protein FACS1894142_5880 [Spirochaetia bacterium]|nr:hypothetical protein FACS1894142_5880 [Spirochaetia bacterium]
MGTPEIEKEGHFLILHSIIMQGGSVTKKKVLDYLEKNGLIKLTEEDYELLPTRNEQKWRNSLSYSKIYLVDNEMLDHNIHNRWKISRIGNLYYNILLEKLPTMEHKLISNKLKWEDCVVQKTE